MKSYPGIRRLVALSFSILVISMLSSFAPPDKVKFSPMLMKKADVDKLMSTPNFSHIILQNYNKGSKDAKRQSYELICYAFNNAGQIIVPYNPLKLTASVPDSAYTKDIYFVNYTFAKAIIKSVLPSSTPYSFLRFQPYEDKSDPLLANYISYYVYAVAADGVTGVVQSKGTAVVKIKLNPSPPR